MLLIVIYMAMSPGSAHAHNVLLSAYVEGDTVVVESGFSDGTFCANATLEVFDPSGKKILEAKTDENGGCSFRPPQQTDLKLVLDAGMGHRAEYTVPCEELPRMTGALEEKTEPASPPVSEDPGLQPSEPLARVDAKEIEAIVDRVVTERLRPLTQLVAKSQRKPGVSPAEIFGGIGYVLGLMKIAMYVRCRKSGKP